MTKDELEAILNGEELLKALDVRTLVLDLVRQMKEEEIVTIFWNKLDELKPEDVRGYVYMKRS